MQIEGRSHHEQHFVMKYSPGNEREKEMYATDFAQVGRNIQTELNAKHMSQQSLADALGVSKQVMSKIVKGGKAINVGELGKIASILGTTTDCLLTITEMPVQAFNFSFMGRILSEGTKGKIELLKTAIEEIRLLEELDDE